MSSASSTTRRRWPRQGNRPFWLGSFRNGGVSSRSRPLAGWAPISRLREDASGETSRAAPRPPAYGSRSACHANSPLVVGALVACGFLLADARPGSAQIVAPAGPPFVISAESNANPDGRTSVATDGTDFFVAWQDNSLRIMVTRVSRIS